MNTGFVLLYRQITEWEWYQNPNTFRVFLHLLLKANFADSRFEGRDIKRGQIVTSLPQLSQQTKLSIQNVRTAISHLISTGEITDESNRQFRIITIVNYDRYQVDNRQANNQLTDDQQTTNRQEPKNQQQYKKNNIKREKGNNNHQSFIAPTVEEVRAYCEERGSFLIDPQSFVDYYETRGWSLKGGQKIRDWKACIRTWENKERERKRQEQLDDLPY